jgi:hypothetical protein
LVVLSFVSQLSETTLGAFKTGKNAPERVKYRAPSKPLNPLFQLNHGA